MAGTGGGTAGGGNGCTFTCFIYFLSSLDGLVLRFYGSRFIFGGLGSGVGYWSALLQWDIDLARRVLPGLYSHQYMPWSHYSSYRY